MSDTVTLTFTQTTPIDLGTFGILEADIEVEKELSDIALHGLVGELVADVRNQLIVGLVKDYLSDVQQVALAADILGVAVSDIA